MVTSAGAWSQRRMALQFGYWNRFETFNVFNVRIYGGPNTNPNSANFGIIDTASQVNFPRTIQLGLRMMF
jgi:hypothetical protein